MRKYSFYLLIVVLLMFTSCDRSKRDKVYSFHGENDEISISNGVIILSEKEDIFYGGYLKIQEDIPLDDIVSYSTNFYWLSEDEKKTIKYHEVEAKTISVGFTESSGNQPDNDSMILVPAINLSLGKKVGKDAVPEIGEGKESDWNDRLYFELVIKNKTGEEKVYSTKLSLTEVTE